MTIDLRLANNSNDGYYMHDVVKVRRGAKATVTNALVIGQGACKDIIDLKDDKGNADTATSISLTNSNTGAMEKTSTEKDMHQLKSKTATPDALPQSSDGQDTKSNQTLIS